MSPDICPLPFASSPYGTSFAGWEQGGNSPWNMLLPSMGPFHTRLPPRSNPKTGSRMYSRRGCFLTEGLQVFRAQKIAAVTAVSKALRKMKRLTSKTLLQGKILPPTEEGAVCSGEQLGSCVWKWLIPCRKGTGGIYHFHQCIFQRRKKSFENGSCFKFPCSWYTARRKLKNLELARKVCGW